MSRAEGARLSIVTPDHRPQPSASLAAVERAAELEARYGSLPPKAVIELVAHELFAGKLAVVSSFGAESAVLLDLVAEVDRHLPILFVDTEKLFGETLRYRDRLVARLGLTGVRTIWPDADEVKAVDPDGILWHRDSDACCNVRKVVPLARTIRDFEAWISGRKRFQASTRADIPMFEADGPRIKVNPLAAWSPEALAERIVARGLPGHPLVAEGYPSIGCMPCTDRVAPGEDARAGRWRGKEKTECGIHLGLSAADETDGSGI